MASIQRSFVAHSNSCERLFSPSHRACRPNSNVKAKRSTKIEAADCRDTHFTRLDEISNRYISTLNQSNLTRKIGRYFSASMSPFLNSFVACLKSAEGGYLFFDVGVEGVFSGFLSRILSACFPPLGLCSSGGG